MFFPLFHSRREEVIFTHLTVYQGEDYRGEIANLGHYTLDRVDIQSGGHEIVMDKAMSGSLSSDGNYLTYITQPIGQDDVENDDIRRHAVYDFAAETLKYYDFTGGYPAFDYGNSCLSPDNSHFVTTLRSGDYNAEYYQALYKVSLTGGSAELLVSTSGHPWYPDYSPDGRWILYTLYDPENKSPVSGKWLSEIYVYDTETGDTIQLLPDSPYSSFGASWSPDGSRFCYFLDKEGTNELYIKDFGSAADGDQNGDIQAGVDETGPGVFALYGNYPNPFNPSTTISFALPGAGTTQVAVYDMAGRLVDEIFNGWMSAGRHELIWNGCDVKGRRVSTGVYIARLIIGDETRSHAMTLLK